MKVNIFGSTGKIGNLSLNIISKKFPKAKINLLVANSNYKILNKQIMKFKPNFVHLNSENKIKYINLNNSKKTKILNSHELSDYLNKSLSDISILSVSGYKSLNYFEEIINNTKNLGLVSKEAVVSAGHLFKKYNVFNKTNIFPLDSEHYSLHEYFQNNKDKFSFNKIILTASGGPFYNKKFSDLSNVTFKEASNHPKWKMGYKNSIDSATLINKCLEVIEAHYLFNIAYEKIDILIHPEALVHSIIEEKNYISKMILFKNDMSIPILNFLKNCFKTKHINDDNLIIPQYSQFTFNEIKKTNFPIYKYFTSLNKEKPINIIKFNIGNEYAVNLFKKNHIKYTDIYKIIKKVGSLNLYSSLNTIKDVINYHEEFEKIIKKSFKNFY